MISLSDPQFFEFLDNDNLYDSLEEFIDLLLEGAAQTEPLEGEYAKDNGKSISTCAFGAVGYAISVKNNFPISAVYVGAVADRAASRAGEIFSTKFGDTYDCGIADYNDEFGRDATVKALKDLL